MLAPGLDCPTQKSNQRHLGTVGNKIGFRQQVRFSQPQFQAGLRYIYSTLGMYLYYLSIIYQKLQF
jgi:hypothetical protein